MEKTTLSRRLEGKVALIMGAGSIGPGWGNGKATAALFAREGAKVIAVDRDPNAAAETCRLIREEGGECVEAVADISVAADVEAVVAKSIDTYGRIDILHNNVGIVGLGNAIKVTEEAWEKSFAVNSRGLMLSCQKVIPHMVEQGGGSIINISTIASVRYLGFSYAAYDASKAAVNALTRSIAVDFGPKGIRANTILIGMVDTPLARGGIDAAGRDVDAVYSSYTKQIPLRRMGTGFETANLALFLASDESSYITAAEIPVDGGLIARCL
ncbi:SDR family NAD(P)-dependent oxidoreductase [Hoeflea sp.]|uniref:SDR family NAD(P)-dependent oxidoreductase n=1 Tax=Hoeflea sp. TaxID=1940281 RepID=UPI0019A76221|nr:SDR family NAD(P)-dependent oxidoreductase [Hoeflea sp.]MBC7285234.1 SDR family oxidoreductase [Hoeflea sp.]